MRSPVQDYEDACDTQAMLLGWERVSPSRWRWRRRLRPGEFTGDSEPVNGVVVHAGYGSAPVALAWSGSSALHFEREYGLLKG